MKRDYFTKADACKTYFAVMVVQVAVMLILAFLPLGQASSNWQFVVLLLQSLVLEIAILATVLVYNKLKNIDTFSAIEIKKKLDWVNLIICLAITVIALVFTFHFFNLIDSSIATAFKFNESSSSFELPQNTISTWPRLLAGIFVLAVVPAFVEEIIFRGSVLNGLKQYTLIGAILLSSVCFAFFHLNVSKFFYQFYVGLIFALVVAFTQDIKLSMIMHFTNNFLVVLIEFLQKRYGFNFFFTWNLSTWLVILIFALSSALIAFLVYILIKRNKNKITKHTVVKIYGKENLISMIMLYGTMFAQFVIALAVALTPAA